MIIVLWCGNRSSIFRRMMANLRLAARVARNLAYIISVTIFSASCARIAFAAHPIYGKCTFATDTSISEQVSVLVRTVGEACYELCDTSCKAAFNIMQTDPNNTDDGQTELMQATKERNMDLIEQCMQSCVRGQTFQTTAAVQPSQSAGDSTFTASNTNVCQPSIAPLSSDWPYKLDMVVSANDSISLALDVTTPSATQSDQLIEDIDDSVYLCGYKSKIIFPQPYSTDNTVSATAANNPDPWTTTSFDANADPTTISGNALWHARSAAWYNTGIYPHDGDFLLITYGGQFLDCAAPMLPEKSTPSKGCYDTSHNKLVSCDKNNACVFNPSANSKYTNCKTSDANTCYASPCPFCTYDKQRATDYGSSEKYLLKSSHIYNLRILNPKTSMDAWVNGFGASPETNFTLTGEDMPSATYFIDSNNTFFSKDPKAGTASSNIAVATEAAQQEDAEATQQDPNPTLGLVGSTAFDSYVYTTQDSVTTGSPVTRTYDFRTNSQQDYLNITSSPPVPGQIAQYYGNRKDYNHSNYRVQTYSGYLNGYSGIMAALGIRHYDQYGDGLPSQKGGSSSQKGDNDWKRWIQHVGGYIVKIRWRGCRYQNGQRLQFIVVPEDIANDTINLPIYLAQQKQWQDVTSNGATDGAFATINIGTQPPAQRNFVFLRIKPLSLTESDVKNLKPDCSDAAILKILAHFWSCLVKDAAKACGNTKARCQDAEQYATNSATYDRSNTIGAYPILATKIVAEDPKEVCGLGSNIVKMFCQNLMGEYCNIDDTEYCTTHKCGTPSCEYCSTTGSIVENTFKLIVTDSSFVLVIQALLVAFTTWIGLSIALGLTKMRNKDNIWLIIKFGIIFTLVSPNSWDFFYSILFKAMFNGMQELMATITYQVQDSTPKVPCISWLPILVSFDDMLDQLKSEPNWARIFAMCMSNATGFVVAIFLIVGFCFAFLAVIKAMLIIITAIVGIALMIIISPLFISFILFKHTSDMGKKWLKQLLVFALEPVFVCAAMSLFIGIMIILFEAIFSFTFCKVCFIKLDLIAFSLCIGEKPLPLFAMHSPDVFYVPMSMLAAMLVLGGMCHTLYVMPSIVSSTVQRLIDFNTSRLEGSASFGGMISSFTQPVQTVIRATTAPYDAVMLAIGRDDTSRKERKEEAQSKVDRGQNDQ